MADHPTHYAAYWKTACACGHTRSAHPIISADGVRHPCMYDCPCVAFIADPRQDSGWGRGRRLVETFDTRIAGVPRPMSIEQWRNNALTPSAEPDMGSNHGVRAERVQDTAIELADAEARLDLARTAFEDALKAVETARDHYEAATFDYKKNGIF